MNHLQSRISSRTPVVNRKHCPTGKQRETATDKRWSPLHEAQALSLRRYLLWRFERDHVSKISYRTLREAQRLHGLTRRQLDHAIDTLFHMRFADLLVTPAGAHVVLIRKGVAS